MNKNFIYEKMPLDKKVIAGLKKALAKEPNVLAAYLFGSKAMGKARPDSDMDLAIVVKDRTKKEEFYFLKRISHLPFSNLDITVVDLQNSSTLFLHQIIKNGFPIYKKSEKERVIFESQAASRFFDSQYLRSIQDFYLEKRLKEGSYGY